MAVLKQRKIDGERRVFRDKLTDQYYSIGIAHGMFPSNMFAPKTPHLFYPSFTCSTLSGPRLH